MAAITLIVELDKLSPAQAQLAAGFILSACSIDPLRRFYNEDESSPANDPSTAFGLASQEGKIDSAGPSVTIPAGQGIAPGGDSLIDWGKWDMIPALPAPPVVLPPPSVSAILDTAGLPWDGRIHASSKAKNTDGTWRSKRNVDDAIVNSVTAELRRTMALPNGPQLVPPAPPPPPIAQSVPPVAATDEQKNLRKDYVDLIGRASAAQGAGRISLEQINKCLTAIGVDSMPSLGHRLDLVPTAASLIDGIIAGQNA